MAELAALDRSGPRHPPRAVKGRVEEPGPALCQEPPLELPTRTKQEPVPRESRDRAQSPVDTQPSPCSPPAMASDQGELVMELLRCFECTQEMARQCCEMLKVLQARWQGAAGACDRNLPGEPFHPLGRMEAQQQLGATVKPQHLEAERPWVDANTDKAEDGDMEKEEDTGRDRSVKEKERSSPVELGRGSLVEVKRNSKPGSGENNSMGPSTSSPPGSGRSTPTDAEGRRDRAQSPVNVLPPPSSPPAKATDDKLLYLELLDTVKTLEEERQQHGEVVDRECDQASPGLCPLGRCLCQCCTRLWHRLKDCWRRCCRPRRVCFSNFPQWVGRVGPGTPWGAPLLNQ
ncbi:uncharacterized protein LOC141737469 [Larus michahellis]|uniref:uncharacterized protein LOC141737469 n=1 Tax=Larus michahellis TaxID=119627 RepID=UPI003D9B333F